jgi:hypothetical protein
MLSVSFTLYSLIALRTTILLNYYTSFQKTQTMTKTLLALFIIFLCTSRFCIAQSPDETLLRKLEQQQKDAIQKGDTMMLAKLMSTEVVVQNPDNNIIRYGQIIQRIRNGQIDYSSFERITEKVTFIQNIAVAMGKEIIGAQGSTANAGKTVTRRYTNIWMKIDGNWMLTARQATIVLVQ